MPETADQIKLRSILWSRIFIVVAIIGLVGLAIYAWQFLIATTSKANFDVYSAFMSLRSTMITTIPFYLVILIFTLGLWAYAMFVDMNNEFRQFNYRPQEALLYVILPVLNLYGIGWTITRIVRVFEHEKLRFDYSDEIQKLKLAITVFYAGLAGLLVSLFFALTMQLDPQMFFRNDFLIFNITEFVVIGVTAGGLIWTVLQVGQIIKTGEKRKEKDG